MSTGTAATKKLGLQRRKRLGIHSIIGLVILIIILGAVVIFEEDVHVLLSSATLFTSSSQQKILKTITDVKSSSTDNEHNDKLPEVLILCTPMGGLTNIKQRLFDCLQSGSEKYPNQDVRFLLPWLMAAPIAGPFIPLELVFNINNWLNWTQSHGYTSFYQQPYLQWKEILGSNSILRHQRASVDQYYNNISSWAEQSNVTMIMIIGDNVPIAPDFGRNAFVLQESLLGGDHSSDYPPIEDACMVHARIEQDWLKYSNNGTNTARYTSLDKIISSLDTSQVCASNKGPTFLTADIDTVKSQCPSCPVYNNSELDYYIQSAAVDFHRAVRADIFIGNIKSSFSALVIKSRSFKRTFTYSEIDGDSCIRPVFHPGYECTNCSLVQTQNGLGEMSNIQIDCLRNDSHASESGPSS